MRLSARGRCPPPDTRSFAGLAVFFHCGYVTDERNRGLQGSGHVRGDAGTKYLSARSRAARKSVCLRDSTYFRKQLTPSSRCRRAALKLKADAFIRVLKNGLKLGCTPDPPSFSKSAAAQPCCAGAQLQPLGDLFSSVR